MTALSRVLPAGFPIHFTSAAGDEPGVCDSSHPQTVDFRLKSLVYGALGCVASAILPQCTFGVSHSPSGDTKS